MELNTVNKSLSDEEIVVKKLYCRNYSNFRNGGFNSSFSEVRKKFRNVLEHAGYYVSAKGNYITAAKNNESLTFYFCAHNANNTNFCIPAVLENEVNYFAFYDGNNNTVNIVSYGIVRKYCKNLANAVIFNNNDSPKFFVKDSWALSQTINSYKL